MRTIALCLVCSCVLTSLAVAADWPQWRGPNRDGISQEKGLLQEWPQEGPKLLWQVKDLGDGYSTPAVVGDRLYVISNKGMDDERVQCLSVADGKEIWSVRIGNVGKNEGPQYPGSRSTPTVDGELLYALGSDGDLACLEIESGKERWKKSLRSDFAGQPGKWAYAESPLVDGDVLVCTPGGAKATIVALDKTSGETIWASKIPEGDQAAYASVIAVEVGGTKQYVQFLEKGLVGVDAKSGKFLWRYEKTVQTSPANIPTPVASGSFVYSSTGRGGGGLVELKADGTAVTAEQVYFDAQLPTSIGGSVLLDGNLYGTNTKGLMCVDFATGDIKWQELGVGAGSVCYADGRLYVHGEDGDVALVEVSGEGYREQGRFTPPNQPDRGPRMKAWAYPVVSNGRLYFRDQGMLWCYDVADPKAK
ncbi:MAG TPA: PQQ-binding-like beta-propeller repeat protein [Pirellulaceae bacterium]|nr:PQQ-binding-like beta-propeller repeat protein [Pirellulaceae bacterium]